MICHPQGPWLLVLVQQLAAQPLAVVQAQAPEAPLSLEELAPPQVAAQQVVEQAGHSYRGSGQEQ
jgi:hypothetical protein